MSDLLEYFKGNNNRLITKWMHYFDIYERHFSPYRNKEITILEIGVFHGGSLQMWKKYFGDKAKIYGIDINPICKEFEEENISVFIGSQSDRNFLRDVIKKIPKIDILIDDGGHTMQQQIVSFEELFDHVADDGIYLCEDLHTSYRIDFGGGYQRKGSFIEYSKRLIDSLNAFHSYQGLLKTDKFTRSVKSMHFYDSMLVIEKGIRVPPHEESTGKPSFAMEKQKVLWENSPFLLKQKPRLFRLAEATLKFFRI